jgi:PAS domain S-box-containing protein
MSRVLVVDGESTVRDEICTSLAESGHEIVLAHDCLAAYRIVRQLGGTVDLVISEAGSPRLPHGELLERLRSEFPDLKAVWIYGETDEVPAASTAFLKMPLSPEVLKSKVNEALQTSRRAPESHPTPRTVKQELADARWKLGLVEQEYRRMAAIVADLPLDSPDGMIALRRAMEQKNTATAEYSLALRRYCDFLDTIANGDHAHAVSGPGAAGLESGISSRLQEVSTRILAAGDARSLYDLIVETASATLNADFATLHMLHPERGDEGELRLLTSCGFSGAVVERFKWICPSSPVFRSVASDTRHRTVIPDIEEGGPLAGTGELQALRDAGIRSLQGTPLLSRSGSLVGALSTYWPVKHELSEAEVRNLDLLARMAADVIETLQAEDRVRDSEQRLRLFVENVRQYALIQADPAGRVASWNPGAERLFGYCSTEMLGQPLSALLTPEDRASSVLERELATVRTAGRCEDERWLLRRDGTRFWGRCITEPEFDGAGHLRGFAKVISDETQRRQDAEVLLQRQKLESVGVLAGGIAHDFNNLLTGIIGHASLMLDEAPPGDDRRLKQVILAAERAAALTKQLLAYSGKGSFIPLELNAAAVIRDIVGLVRPAISDSIRVCIRIEEPLPSIRMDPGQFQQLMVNLMMNAAEAIGEEEGDVSVTAHSTEVKKPFVCVLGRDVAPGQYVAIEVRDSGPGVDQEIHSRIFDPFFTTKFTGRGLGLAAVAGIVRAQNGAVTFESEPGKGSTFRILIPVAEN